MCIYINVEGHLSNCCRGCVGVQNTQAVMFVAGVCGCTRYAGRHLCLGPVLPANVEPTCDGRCLSGATSAVTPQVHGRTKPQSNERGLWLCGALFCRYLYTFCCGYIISHAVSFCRLLCFVVLIRYQKLVLLKSCINAVFVAGVFACSVIVVHIRHSACLDPPASSEPDDAGARHEPTQTQVGKNATDIPLS